MKIRTPIELQDAIDAEMGWRKRELTALKANIQAARSFAKDTALRSGVALLYAHWEGAIKNISYYYLCYVSSLKIPYDKLTRNFLAIAMKAQLKDFSESSKTSLHTKIIDAIFDQISCPSRIPQEGIINTKSNLNSAVFSEIAHTIGLKTDLYEPSYTLIDEILLNMRNKIAHGDRLDILSLDEDRYYEIHGQIFKIIDNFAIDVSNSAVLKSYMANR